MNPSTKALLEGLVKAIKAERDGQSFYLMAARSTEDARGKRVFEMMAGEELEHMKLLTAQYDAILKTGRPDLTFRLGQRSALDGLSPIFSEALKKRISEAHIEMSALSIAIQLELDAMNFYKAEAGKTQDEDVRKFYNELADWESGHYHTLISQQEYLKEDYWTDSRFSPF